MRLSSAFGSGRAVIKINTRIGALVAFASIMKKTFGTAESPERKPAGFAPQPSFVSVAGPSRSAQLSAHRAPR